MNKTYRMQDLIIFLLLSFRCLASPSLGRKNLSGAKVFPYCNSPDDPSIPCDETYPNGTYIDGNRPNPNATCSNIFFQCTNGVSKCFNCQDVEGIRLYYDHPQLECDYRENVEGCTGVPDSTIPSSSISFSTISTIDGSTTPTSTSGMVPTIPEGYVCPEENGFFPIDPNKCLPDYYVCVNGAPSIGTCPPGGLFDPAVLYCVQEGQSSCRTMPTIPAGYICPDDNGFFPIDPTRCLQEYYVCVNGAPSIGTCPPGGLFDPAVLYCVPEEQASCNSPTTKTTSTTERTTVPTVPPGYVCPDINGFFPIKPDQCLPNYYICVNGVPNVGTCPPGSIFDPVTLYCVPEEQATCNFICPASNGFFPVPGYETEQCFNGYITCVSFKPYPTTCPADSVFDPDVLFCVYPQDNGCVA